jgi:hypothetical protein
MLGASRSRIWNENKQLVDTSMVSVVVQFTYTAPMGIVKELLGVVKELTQTVL